MPSEALNALIAKQQGDLGTLLPTTGTTTAKDSFHNPTTNAAQASRSHGGGVGRGIGGVSKDNNSDFHNQRAGLGSTARDRLQDYEGKVLHDLAKRKEDDARHVGGGRLNKNKNVAGAAAGGHPAESSDTDFDPSNGSEVIERCFVSIGGVKAFTSFQRLSPAEIECIDTLGSLKASIMANQTRDLHINELVSCITGNDDEEEDEPIGPQAFSQYYFYNAYIRDLVYFPDRFDFLIRCIENSVVKVAKPSRFLQLLERIAARGRVDVLPDQVVNYERLLEEDEERRLESFTLKKDWVCQVPHYLDGVGGAEGVKAGLPPVTTVEGTWNHKDSTVDLVRAANASPTPSEDDRAREEEERKANTEIDQYLQKTMTTAIAGGAKGNNGGGGGSSGKPAGVLNEEGRPSIEALAIITDPSYQWRRIRVPQSRATEDEKQERRVSTFEFSSNRRTAAKDHAKMYPSHDGKVRLPQEGEWSLDEDADGMYWCSEPKDVALYFDPVSGQYYDPATECWYYEGLGGWHSVA